MLFMPVSVIFFKIMVQSFFFLSREYKELPVLILLSPLKCSSFRQKLNKTTALTIKNNNILLSSLPSLMIYSVLWQHPQADNPRRR